MGRFLPITTIILGIHIPVVAERLPEITQQFIAWTDPTSPDRMWRINGDWSAPAATES